jgi:regulator of cell morphogenesis and NO signaling
MKMTQEVTVAEIAANSLAAVNVFEKLGIDYCCGGKRPLAEVCVQKGYNPAEVQRELETAMSAQAPAARDWNSAPLTELIDHIVGTHHEYLKREMAPLQARLEKVFRVYNERYGPTLTGLPEVYAALRSELELHLRKEEMILFPAVFAYAAASESGLPLPRPPFGTVNNPIRMMETEHDSAGSALARIREITNNFEVPEYACVTYRSLMAGLRELEEDLHMHIHLENNVLFPRAASLEASAR